MNCDQSRRMCRFFTFLLLLLSDISHDVIDGVWDHVTLFPLYTEKLM